ncbi:MAG: TldD/PmbA family protein [Planctomycetota bacterium]
MNKKSIQRVAKAAAEEVDRAMESIQLRGHPRPYYISHLIRDEEVWRLQAKYGALHSDYHRHRRSCLADVRVGSYKYDQVQEGGLEDSSTDDESYEYVEIPVGDQMDGVRHALWRLTEARYREAIDGFLQRKSNEVTYLNKNRHLRAFEERPPIVDRGWSDFPEVDLEAWREFVIKASANYKRYPLLKNGHVSFQARHTVHTFVNSEGSRLIQCRPYFSMTLYFWYLSEKGDALPYSHSILVSDPTELPDLAATRKTIRNCYALLERLAAAPTVRSFSGPVLLDPIPAGLMIHEAVGHRLEGSRLLSTGEGQTFRDSVGQQVLPEFLTMRDDPTVQQFDGKSLVGHYKYDDEGTPASNAQLIERGVLRGFLTSRTPIYRKHESNGHARSRYHQRCISRMGNTIVESHDGLDDKQLRAAFIEEIKRQGVPYGVRIIEASGGETATGSYDFQAFLGEINVASRVYPDGREELIRGVDFVGTPLNAIRNIIAAGKEYGVDNAYCGAESGFVPVTTISPSLLVSELELQSKSETPYTQYVYPMPWEQNGKE